VYFVDRVLRIQTPSIHEITLNYKPNRVFVATPRS